MGCVKELFNRWAENGDDVRAEEEHSYAVKKVLDSLKWNDSDSYLDIGCGNGYTLRYVSRYTHGRLKGIDLSDKMIERARSLSMALGNASFELTDFTEWDAGKQRFDKIFSMEAFYYFKDVRAAIKRSFSLLKKNGVFACIVDFYAENKASEVWPDSCHCNVPMQRFSMNEWKEMFIEAGFRDIEQFQIRYPREIAKDDWQIDTGSLVTIGHNKGE